METTLERVQSIKDQMNELEKRINDETHSLTLEQLEQLDGEWEILDAELAMYEDVLFDQQLAEQAELDIIEGGEEEEIVDDALYWNPSDEEVAQLYDGAARFYAQVSLLHGHFGGRPVEDHFDLADEI